MYGLDAEPEPARDRKGDSGHYNVWRSAGSVVKYFRFDWRSVLWEISWANIVMLSISIPKYERDAKEEIKDVDDVSELEGLIGL
jgi:hypothetical protein